MRSIAQKKCIFLDALASLDFKLSVSQSLSDSPFSSIKASASTGLSEFKFVSKRDPESRTFFVQSSTMWMSWFMVNVVS